MQAQSAEVPEATAGDDRSAQEPIRLKLLSGFSAAIAESGYGATTIADIVRHARVSKRTFYEHFEDKEACFLAAYARMADHLLAGIAAAAGPDLPVSERLHAAANTYFAALESQPALARTFLLEVHAGGPRAIALRRVIHRRFADLLRRLVQAARKENAAIRPLTAPMATAIVGGINELVLVALEKGKSRKLSELASTAEELVRAVLGIHA